MTNESDKEFDEVLQLLLERSGLEAWTRICMSLLALTEGIERYMDQEDEHPHRDLRQRLQRTLSRNEAQLLDIAGLQVFEYRAMSEETLELWQPLAESFQRFGQRHAGRIRVWKAFSAYPNRATIEDWLSKQVSSNDKCQGLPNDRFPSGKLRR
jgi:hypothetical protein